jgi:hypothetical protein
MRLFKLSDCDIHGQEVTSLSIQRANQLLEAQKHEEQEFLRDLISINEHIQESRLRTAFIELKEKARKLIK